MNVSDPIGLSPSPSFQRLARRAGLRILASCLLMLAAVASVGCEGSEPASSEPTNGDAAKKDEKFVVFAAASLKEAFTAMAEAFKKVHPGAEITFNFAGSQELRTQIEHGGPADVFASADKKHMDELLRSGKVKNPAIFARNEPVLVVAMAKASTVRSMADLPSVPRIVIGVPEVPIGRYTLQILDNASRTLGADFRSRVEGHVVSRELNVRQVLAKVTLGEADAGIVYRTDVPVAEGKVTIVAIPAEMNVIAEYPIAVITNAPSAALGEEWVKLILSPDGQALMKKSGFLVPAAP